MRIHLKHPDCAQSTADLGSIMVEQAVQHGRGQGGVVIEVLGPVLLEWGIRLQEARRLRLRDRRLGKPVQRPG